MKTKLFIICALLLLVHEGLAQSKYWVYFKEKDTTQIASLSPETRRNRELLNIPQRQYSDLAVAAQNIKIVKLFSSENPIVVSKWLNALSIYLTPGQAQELLRSPQVSAVVPIQSHIRLMAMHQSPEQKIVEAIRQMNATELRSTGLTGKGVAVGIIDGGFAKADNTPALRRIFAENRVVQTKDFLAPGSNLMQDIISENDSHGTAVFMMIGGEDPRVKYGVATDASFYLARTDHGKYEFRGEEDFWIAALEWMDSVGVRLVNSSLGYSIDFDKPSENHNPSEVDGSTAAITKAARIAVREKGMILVNSAGNDGGNAKWAVVNLPADAEEVITVGASDWQGLKREYSSVGPRSVSFVKPDVVCYSDGGSSLAAPAITGLIACMLQRRPAMTAAEIKSIIKQNAHVYPYCNNFIGCGVPDVKLILDDLAYAKKVKQRQASNVMATGESYKIPVSQEESVLIFHKDTDIHVLRQTTLDPVNGAVIVSRPRDATRTTVVLSRRVVEISWK